MTGKLTDAIRALRQLNSDSSHLDYIGGVILHDNILNWNTEWDFKSALRALIREVLEITSPWWLRLFPYGRTRVQSALGQDQLQCFREAGLFDEHPHTEIISWWDELAAKYRGEADLERMLRGRLAERLSFEHEMKRISALGLDLRPVWVALDDNSLGYDIKSFDVRDGQIITRLLEVKGAMSDVYFVTRNEWDNAVSAGSSYKFHIWKLREATLIELTVPEVEPHIPADNGAGRWQDVRITLTQPAI